ncbi:MAG: hypothetical protein WCT39_01190 [Candidatus Margulisiibacteriota bacterium]
MPEQEKWYYSVPGVLVLLFLILGPLALPLLFKSPKFNLLSKIVLTAIVLAGTIVVFNLLAKTFEDLAMSLGKMEMLLNP